MTPLVTKMRLCERNSLSTPLTQKCLDEHLLQFASKKGGTKYYVNNENSQYYINTGIHLPKNVKCTKCVLQWHYRVGKRFFLTSCPTCEHALDTTCNIK